MLLSHLLKYIEKQRPTISVMAASIADRRPARRHKDCAKEVLNGRVSLNVGIAEAAVVSALELWHKAGLHKGKKAQMAPRSQRPDWPYLNQKQTVISMKAYSHMKTPKAVIGKIQP